MITLSYLTLFLIISLSAGCGMFVTAIFAGSDGGKADSRDECYYCPLPCERNK